MTASERLAAIYRLIRLHREQRPVGPMVVLTPMPGRMP